MMLLQNHQQLDILREEDLTMMTSSGEVNLYSADFKHDTQRRASSAQGPVESSSSSAPTANEPSKDMKAKRKTSVFSKLGGYKFRKSVPQCRKETRSASWTAIPGEVPCFVDETPDASGVPLLGDGLMNKQQEGQQVKQVFTNISRNSSLSIAKSKSNSLPMKASFDNNPFERLDQQEGNKAFQHESDTNEDSDVSEGLPDNVKKNGVTKPSKNDNKQIHPAGSMRWKRVANKFGIDSLRKAFKDGLTSPSNSSKTFLNKSNNSPSHSNNSSGSNLLTGMEMTDSNCSITLSAPDSFGFRPSKVQQQQQHHVRRASLAVECVRDSSSSSSSPFLLSSSSSSLQQQKQNNPGQLLAVKQQQQQDKQQALANSIILPFNYDSDNDKDQTLRPKPWQHRNSFQSVLQFSQQQHLLQLQQQQQQQQQQQLQLFHDSLLKIAALDVSFLDQSEAEAWSLTVPRTRLAKLSEREVKYQNHVWELIQTEKNHLRTLLTMQKVFVEGLMEEVKMNEKMIDKLFPALHDLIFFHYTFLKQLIQLQNSSDDKFITEIGPTLISLFSGPNGERMKEVYGDFCTRHSEALQVYKESLKGDINFQRFIKKCSYNPQCKRLTVPECILLVAQRPTKYPLLIEPILETTQKGSSEHEWLQKCLSECRLVLDEINHEIDSKSKSSKLVEICNRIDSKSSFSINGQVYKKCDIFSSQRRLVLEGGAKMVLNKNKQQDVYMVLLSDTLLLFQESGQKLNFCSLENKSSVISLKSLLVREKGDSRDCKGLYLICYSDTLIPEMLELSFKSLEERNRWSVAIKEAIKFKKQDEVDSNITSLVSYEEATPLVGQAFRTSQSQTRRKGSTLDEATLAQLYSLINQLRLKDNEICHLLNEKLKTVSTIAKILSPDDDEVMMVKDQSSLQEWMNIAFTEGTKLLALSTLSPTSVGSVDSYLSHDFEDAIRIEAPSDDAASECSSATILPKRAETFAGFDSRKPSKEGNIMARPSSATLNKKAGTVAISKSQLKDYEQCNTSSSTAMQNSICSTTSGVRSSSFEGQSSSFEGQGHLLTPAQCSSVGKLLSAVQKISVQALSQITEMQSLNIQLAKTRTNQPERRESEDSPSSSSSSFCQNDDISLNIEVSSILATTSSGTLSSKSISSMSVATTFSPSVVTTTVMSTIVSSFTTSLSPPVIQERVKVVRPTFLPFSPLKFQPLYPKKSYHQEDQTRDGNIIITTTTVSSLPSSTTSCSSVASSSLPSTPQVVPGRDRCQSFPKKYYCTCGESGNFGKCRGVEDLSMFKEDGLTYVGDDRMSCSSSTPFAEDFLTDPLAILEAELDNHLTISDSQITILIDSCPDESSFNNNNNLFEPADNNNYTTELSIQELNLDNIACCRSCSELFRTKDCEIHKLQKSLSTQTFERTKTDTKTDTTTRNNNFERTEATTCNDKKTPSSLSLYFK